MITNDINGALLLLIVGMVTVFLVLIIVIWLGKALIWGLNKWGPEEKATPKAAAAANAVAAIDTKTRKIIDEAVKQISGGQGRVKTIKKL